MALTILDGGMGNELLRRTPGASGGLWSAQVLLDNPALVAAVHQDYVDAGAEVLITNSYSTIPSYLAKADMADRYLELTALAGQIARQVADQSDQVTVAGSIPPLDESYRFDLAPPAREAVPIYRSLVEALLPYVDLFVCETMSCIDESVNALTALREVAPQARVWLAWSLAETPDQGLRSGEPIEQAVAAVAEFGVEAYLFNCTSPEAISAGLQQLRTFTDRPIGAYPNCLHIPQGWTLDNQVATGRRDMSPAEFLQFAQTWQGMGATILGGCCGIGPDHIAKLPGLKDSHAATCA